MLKHYHILRLGQQDKAVVLGEGFMEMESPLHRLGEAARLQATHVKIWEHKQGEEPGPGV